MSSVTSPSSSSSSSEMVELAVCFSSSFSLCNQLLNAFWHHLFCSIIVGVCVRIHAMPYALLVSWPSLCPSISNCFFLFSAFCFSVSLLFTTISNNWKPVTSSSPSKHEWMSAKFYFDGHSWIRKFISYHVISNLCNKLYNQSIGVEYTYPETRRGIE